MKRSRFTATPRPDLTVRQILAWADEFHARVGRWPNCRDGAFGLTGTTWHALDDDLINGHRGLAKGSSLAKLLLAKRGRRHRLFPPRLTADLILAWADAHRRRTGDWPHQTSGPVAGAPGEKWQAIDSSLAAGRRGLPGGSSLALLLRNEREVRHQPTLPRLTLPRILAWADAHHARAGAWPFATSGEIHGTGGETWSIVEDALRAGKRGLPGGDTLARLLARRRGKRNAASLPRLSVAAILRWADEHRVRTGRWPTDKSGPVAGAPGETWRGLAAALSRGRRGLPGGDSLAHLLASRRGMRSLAHLPPYLPEEILAWADEHRSQTGRWPQIIDGGVGAAPGETWRAVGTALERGGRGLPGGDTLARFLARHRGVRNHMELPRFKIADILAWADKYRARTGSWPTAGSGPIPGSGESWQAVEGALLQGMRGLPGGDSLAKLLARFRGKRNRKALPPLKAPQIRNWIRDHRRRTGAWPRAKDGPIPDSGGETWAAVETALRNGNRGLPGGSSLAAVVRSCGGGWKRVPTPALVAGVNGEQK